MSPITPCVSLLLLWPLLESASASDCLPTQYKHKSWCCDFCQPGLFVKEHCSASENTVCETCPDGAFLSKEDNMEACMPCRTCQRAERQVLARACRPTADAICSCEAGFECDGEECEACTPTLPCAPGEQRQRKGTFRYIYACVRCPNNSYFDTADNQCKPWTQCNVTGLDVISPGNRTHDTRCGPRSSSNEARKLAEEPYLLVLVLVVFLIFGFVLLALLLDLSIRRVRQSRRMKTRDSMMCYPLSREEKGEVFAPDDLPKALLADVTPGPHPPHPAEVDAE